MNSGMLFGQEWRDFRLWRAQMHNAFSSLPFVQVHPGSAPVLGRHVQEPQDPIRTNLGVYTIHQAVEAVYVKRG